MRATEISSALRRGRVSFACTLPGIKGRPCHWKSSPTDLAGFEAKTRAENGLGFAISYVHQEKPEPLVAEIEIMCDNGRY
jgi:hypothetical protein